MEQKDPDIASARAVMLRTSHRISAGITSLLVTTVIQTAGTPEGYMYSVVI